jgi:hypothetical protein
MLLLACLFLSEWEWFVRYAIFKITCEFGLVDKIPDQRSILQNPVLIPRGWIQYSKVSFFYKFLRIYFRRKIAEKYLVCSIEAPYLISNWNNQTFIAAQIHLFIFCFSFFEMIIKWHLADYMKHFMRIFTWKASRN